MTTSIVLKMMRWQLQWKKQHPINFASYFLVVRSQWHPICRRRVLISLPIPPQRIGEHPCGCGIPLSRGGVWSPGVGSSRPNAPRPPKAALPCPLYQGLWDSSEGSETRNISLVPSRFRSVAPFVRRRAEAAVPPPPRPCARRAPPWQQVSEAKWLSETFRLTATVFTLFSPMTSFRVFLEYPCLSQVLHAENLKDATQKFACCKHAKAILFRVVLRSSFVNMPDTKFGMGRKIWIRGKV